jgi:hypothetical protein
VVVSKAAATVSASVAPRKVVAKKTRATVRVGVLARGLTPTGTVTLKLGKRTVTGTLVNGRAVLKLPRFKKAGTVRGTLTYRGDAWTAGATATLKIKVRKKR